MRALDSGQSFTVTRNGVAVGELIPAHRERFVGREAILDAFAGVPAIDGKRFRGDVDRLVSQDPTPRG